MHMHINISIGIGQVIIDEETGHLSGNHNSYKINSDTI